MSYIHLLPSCTITDGHRRSLLHDMQSSKSRLLSREVAAALKQYSGKPVQELQSYLQDLGLQPDAFEQLIGSLTAEGFLLPGAVPIAFEPMPMMFDWPFAITNAIIDIAETNRHLWQKMIAAFQSISCPHLQLRLYKDLAPDDGLIHMLAAFAAIDTLDTLELIMPFFEGFDTLPGRLGTTAQLSLVLYQAPASELRPLPDRLQAVCIAETLDFPSCCGIVDIAYFNFGMQHYTEAIHHNSCLNRKISIDQYGYIKNCPSMTASFGHVEDRTLAAVLENNAFYAAAGITKDQVAVCSSCEFRYVCTDCRAYLEQPEDIYSKPLKCGYNPFTCTWEDWRADPARQAAIGFYGL